MKIYNPEDGGHWYDEAGVPHHFRPNGKPTTLADARKQGWFPSVTKIIGDICPKPALVNWKVSQGILASLTLPRAYPGEPDNEFVERVVVDMEAESVKARQVGHDTHAMMAEVLINPRQAEDWTSLLDKHSADAFAFAQSFSSWRLAAIQKVHWSERILVHPDLGYAGTCDALVELSGLSNANAELLGVNTPTILDFKVRKKAATYREDLFQLAAYRLTMIREGYEPDVASVVLDKTNPEALPLVYHWSREEVEEATETFKLMLQLWKRLNNYDPITALNSSRERTTA